MSLKPVTVQVCGEVDNVLDVVLSVFRDVKAGKSAVSVVTDAVPAFTSALAGLGDLSTELADRKDLEKTIALKLTEFVDVLAPVTQPL